MPNCKNCNKNFPNLFNVNGKVRNLSSRKYCLQCSPFGQHRTRPIIDNQKALNQIGVTKVCKDCNSEYTYKHNCDTVNFCSYCYSRNHKTVYSCIVCGEPCRKNKSKCLSCYNNDRDREVLSKTKSQIKELYKEKSSMAIAAKIRGYGSTIYKRSDKPKYCVNCGYDKHYEVCHIKQVKDFPDTASMAEIHALDNLIALCPNCHWELDHGMLRIQDIVK